MSFCPFLDPQQTTHQSNVGIWLRWVTKLGPLTLFPSPWSLMRDASYPGLHCPILKDVNHNLSQGVSSFAPYLVHFDWQERRTRTHPRIPVSLRLMAEFFKGRILSTHRRGPPLATHLQFSPTHLSNQHQYSTWISHETYLMLMVDTEILGASYKWLFTSNNKVLSNLWELPYLCILWCGFQPINSMAKYIAPVANTRWK